MWTTLKVLKNKAGLALFRGYFIGKNSPINQANS
jgi:hypothetical protein